MCVYRFGIHMGGRDNVCLFPFKTRQFHSAGRNLLGHCEKSHDTPTRSPGTRFAREKPEYPSERGMRVVGGVATSLSGRCILRKT